MYCQCSPNHVGEGCGAKVDGPGVVPNGETVGAAVVMLGPGVVNGELVVVEEWDDVGLSVEGTLVVFGAFVVVVGAAVVVFGGSKSRAAFCGCE